MITSDGHRVPTALYRLYSTIYALDLEDDTFSEYVSLDYFREYINGITSARELIQAFISCLIESDRQRASELLNPDTLPERLAGSPYLEGEFVSRQMGWLRLLVIPIEKGRRKTSRVLICTRDINSEKNKEAITKEELKLQQEIVNALTADYMNVFVLQPATDRSVVVKLQATYVRGLEEGTKSFSHREITANYSRNRMHPDDREAMAAFWDLDNIQRTIPMEKEMSHTFRYLDNGREHYCNCRIIHLSGYGEKMRVIVAFHDVDKDIRDELENNRLRTEEQHAMALNAIHDSMGSGSWEIYFDEQGEVTGGKLSDTFLKMSGLSSASDVMVNLHSWIDRIHPDDSMEVEDQFWSMIHDREGKATFDAEFRLNTYERGYRWFRSAAKAVRRENGIPITCYGVFFDIEEARRSAVQLEQAKNVIESAGMGTWRIEMPLGQPQRMYADERMLELLGITDPDMDPEDVYDFWFNNIRPEALQSVYDSVQLMSEGTQDENTYLWHHPTLGDRYVRCGGIGMRTASGTVLRGYHYDVDRQYRNELEQNRIVEVLSRDFTNVYIANLAQNHFTIVKLNGYVPRGLDNSRVLEEKYPYDETVKNYIKDRVHPDDQEKLALLLDNENLLKIMEANEEYRHNYRVVENGEVHFYQARCVRMSKNHFILGFANIDATVEEEHRQQELLQNALDAAEHANRAKTSFLNNMSHDIRTPMNAILGFTELAQTHIDNQELVEEYLKKISTSGDHLLSLINDVLDMSRIESGNVKLEVKPLNLTDLIRDIRTIIQPNAEAKGLEFFADTCEIRHEYLIADKLRLNQIFLNILSNSIKYTMPGGSISLRIAEVPSQSPNFAAFEFHFKDTGMGMSPEFQKHIFEAFTREENSTISGIQGTGLGMAITKNIVDMMGGSISVESEQGKGTEFTVCLQFRISEEPVESSRKKNEPRDYTGIHLLLVEDNELNQEIAQTLLEEAGFLVTIVGDGLEAVETMKTAAPDTYDLILMDIQMPHMDGYEATRQIRGMSQQGCDKIPIIAMTANAFEEDRQQAYAAGMNAHVSKPIRIETVEDAIDQVLGIRR